MMGMLIIKTIFLNFMVKISGIWKKAKGYFILINCLSTHQKPLSKPLSYEERGFELPIPLSGRVGTGVSSTFQTASNLNILGDYNFFLPILNCLKMPESQYYLITFLHRQLIFLPTNLSSSGEFYYNYDRFVKPSELI